MAKYCIIGTDERSNQIRKMYQEDGVEIVDYKKADYIIAPIPFSRDGIKITGEILSVEEIIASLSTKVLFTGAISEEIKGRLAGKNYADLMELDEVAYLNAIPTAVGAIYEAIKHSNITISGANVLVMGYGRIGKILAKMLDGIGAHVFCEARKEKDLAFIEAMGYNRVSIDELNSYLPKMDYIFNTIPAKLLNQTNMKYISQDCTIIDLASAPGGMDFNLASHMGLNVTWALSLPSKVAPKSAAIYLKNTIDQIIKEKYCGS